MAMVNSGSWPALAMKTSSLKANLPVDRVHKFANIHHVGKIQAGNGCGATTRSHRVLNECQSPCFDGQSLPSRPEEQKHLVS